MRSPCERGWRIRAAGASVPKVVAVVLLGLTLVAAGLPVTEAEARPPRRYSLGIGLASTSVAGDLDGSQTYMIDSTNGPIVWAGKPDRGGGVHVMGGIDFNPYVTLEGHLISTGHETTHDALPNEQPLANIGSIFAAGRLNLPLGDAFEVFGRLGIGGVTLNYEGNAELQPNPTRLNSSFSGVGYMGGAGIAMYFDPVGVELGVLRQQASLRNLTSADQTTNIPALRLQLTTVTLTLVVHFGGPPPNPESAFPPDERPPPKGEPGQPGSEATPGTQ